MNKSVETRPLAPLVHGRIIYRCGRCGESWPMYLEKGIEEFGENHKPSPFLIGCPYCGGLAQDVSGIHKVPDGGYVPLPDGYHYFANREDHPCGVPTFTVRSAGNIVTEDVSPEDASMVIADVLAHLCREDMREEQARMEEIINRTMPDEAEAVRKTSVIIAEKTGISLEKAVGAVLRMIQEVGNNMNSEFDPFLGEPDLAALEPGDPLDISTAWDRKEAREKRRAEDRATASRFRQYKARENAWGAWKRTGPRRREWRGADRV